MHNIKDTLEMWGRWARANPNNDWRSVAAGFQNMEPSERRAWLTCSDEEGMVIDAAVLRLKQYDEMAFNFIVVHYVYRVSQSKIAKEISKSQSYVMQVLRVSEAYIAGQLDKIADKCC